MINKFYAVTVTAGGATDVQLTTANFIKAMELAERLSLEHQQVDVFFVHRTLCKRWEHGTEVPTRDAR